MTVPITLITTAGNTLYSTNQTTIIEKLTRAKFMIRSAEPHTYAIDTTTHPHHDRNSHPASRHVTANTNAKRMTVRYSRTDPVCVISPGMLLLNNKVTKPPVMARLRADIHRLTLASRVESACGFPSVIPCSLPMPVPASRNRMSGTWTPRA